MYYHTKYPQATSKQKKLQYITRVHIHTLKDLLRCVASAEEGEVHDGGVVWVEFVTIGCEFEDGSHVGRGAGEESVLMSYSIDVYIERYK